jgi:hypothetical protein
MQNKLAPFAQNGVQVALFENATTRETAVLATAAELNGAENLTP